MKRIDFVKFIKDLERVDISNFNKFLVYSIRLTKNKCQPIIDDISEKEKELFFPEYVIAEQKRFDILFKYSKKDENNKPLFIQEEFIIEDVESCKNELIKNRETFKDVYDKYIQLEKSYNEFMNVDIEVPFVKTSFSNIPDNIKDKTTDDILYKFVKESEEELEKLIG